MVNSALYDPDLPTALAVMGALCCVASQYVHSPSKGLAETALRLAKALSAPEYAESSAVTTIAQQLQRQWADEMRTYGMARSVDDAVRSMASYVPQHTTMQ
jgi:hypothetical protein